MSPNSCWPERVFSARPHAPELSSPALWLLACTALLPATTALAAPPPATDLSPASAIEHGFRRNVGQVAGEGDTTANEYNPALLTGRSRFDLGLRAGFPAGRLEPAHAALPQHLGGFGVYASSALPFGLALGLDFQQNYARSWAESGRRYDRRISKYGFGLALALSPSHSVGLSLHGLRDSSDKRNSGLLRLGWSLHASRFISLGAAFSLAPLSQRAALPQGPQGELARVWGPRAARLSLDTELALRPMGRRWLEISGGLRSEFDDYGEKRRELSFLPRGRLHIRAGGFSVGGQVELHQLRSGALDGEDRDHRRLGVRGGIELRLAFQNLAGGVGLSLHDHRGPALQVGLDYARRSMGDLKARRPLGVEKIELGELSSERGLISALLRLERAADAGPRTTLLLDTDDLKLGWGDLQELREALQKVKAAGGRIFVWSEGMDMKAYFVASLAERIFLHPAAKLELVGLRAHRLYYADALNKVGIRAEVVRVGRFKSAYEKFSSTGPSQADREQRVAILDGIYTNWLQATSSGRGFTQAHVRTLLDQGPFPAPSALKNKLIDEIVHPDELDKALNRALGRSENAPLAHRSFPRSTAASSTWGRDPYIGILLVDGTISNGESLRIPFFGLKSAGAETIIPALEALVADPACRSILVRVDSPGGSAFGSERLWRAVERAGERKTLVVSMGDVAASGGYYLAASAKKIFARPLTITGSIGIISMRWDISGLAQMLGVRSNRIERGQHVGLRSIWQPLDPSSRARLQASINAGYELFLQRVAGGRSMSRDRVHAQAQGRVMLAKRALKVGLIDSTGGLIEAIEWLRQRSGLPSWERLDIRVTPRPPSLIRSALGQLGLARAEEVGTTPTKTRRRRLRLAPRDQRAIPLPPALTDSLRSLPLELLYLPTESNLALMPGRFDVE